MQSFFNNNQDNEEERLEELTNTIFETLVRDLESNEFRYLPIPPWLRASLRDTVYKLVKIASQQNKLLLQFPAILAYFVYNFLKNIDLDRLNYINEKLDELQRLIQRKNLQGLSFNTIKQMLQQELQEKKFRPRQKEQKQSGNKQGEKKQGGEEGQESEEEGNEGEQSNSQEGQESEGGNEESQNEEESGEQGQELEGETGKEEGEQGEEGQGSEKEGQNSEEQEGQSGEQGEEQGSESGEESGEQQEQELGEEGQESENEGENVTQESEGQEGEESEWESENEGQSGEQGQESQEGTEQEQSGNEGQEGEEGQSGEEQGEGVEEGGEQGGEESGEGEESEGSQSGEEGEQGEESEGEEGEEQSGEEGNQGQNGEESQGELGESEQENGEEQGEEGEGGESGEEGGEQGGGESEGGSQGGEQQGGEESEEGQSGEQGQESEGGEGQEIEDITEDLENDINEESEILDELEESLQKSLSVLSIGEGSGGGVLKDVNPRVLELLDRANRIMALANQVDLQYANRGVKDQGGVMKGITTGNNVKHMFKSQLILPDEIFLERYTNRALLQRAVENEGVRDLYFMIDKSRSMISEMPNGYTALENVSAVALASAMEAEKNNKKVFVQYFDDSATEPLDVNNVFELAQIAPGGGTDMMVALKRFMDYYNNYPGLKDVKQIFILSDFETNYDKQTLQDFKNFARNNDLVVTCIHVYNGEVPDEMQHIIDEICDEYYKFNKYDASELFSAVYSKV